MMTDVLGYVQTLLFEHYRLVVKGRFQSASIDTEIVAARVASPGILKWRLVDHPHYLKSSQ